MTAIILYTTADAEMPAESQPFNMEIPSENLTADTEMPTESEPINIEIPTETDHRYGNTRRKSAC